MSKETMITEELDDLELGKVVNEGDPTPFAGEDEGWCIRESARYLLGLAGNGDYLSKLRYAALVKGYEGDFDYVDALLRVAEGVAAERSGWNTEDNYDEYAKIFGEGWKASGVSSEALLKQSRKQLADIIEKRSKYADFNYHKYFQQFVLATLPEYDPENEVPVFTKITLKKPYIKESDYGEIQRLLGFEDGRFSRPSGDVLRVLLTRLAKAETEHIYPQTGERVVEDISVPDHPERYVFDYVVVPPTDALSALNLREVYCDLAIDTEHQGVYLDQLFGVHERGRLRDCVADRNIPKRFRVIAHTCLGYMTFSLPCFGLGGKYARWTAFVGELEGKEE